MGVLSHASLQWGIGAKPPGGGFGAKTPEADDTFCENMPF